MGEQAMWTAGAGVWQTKETASRIGVWLMCLRKTKPVWLENERVMRVAGGQGQREVGSRS